MVTLSGFVHPKIIVNPFILPVYSSLEYILSGMESRWLIVLGLCDAVYQILKPQTSTILHQTSKLKSETRKLLLGYAMELDMSIIVCDHTSWFLGPTSSSEMTSMFVSIAWARLGGLENSDLLFCATMVRL
jgi:hypothetical protein